MKVITAFCLFLVTFPVICYVIVDDKKLSRKEPIQQEVYQIVENKEVQISRGNEAPSVSLSLESCKIIANAFDLDGEIKTVEFFQNGESIGIDSIYPYQLKFQTNQEIKGVFSAKATDDLGTYSLSIAVNKKTPSL